MLLGCMYIVFRKKNLGNCKKNQIQLCFYKHQEELMKYALF